MRSWWIETELFTILKLRMIQASEDQNFAKAKWFVWEIWKKKSKVIVVTVPADGLTLC